MSNFSFCHSVFKSCLLQRCLIVIVIFSLFKQATLTYLLPLMERLLNMDPDQSLISSRPTQCLNLLIERFTVDSVGCLTANKPGLNLFLRSLKVSKCTDKVKSPQLTAISQVNLV